jgi:hypothetical protein
MHIIYVHGFASSSRSTKAAYFRERLAAHGLDLDCPDLNEPDFSTLTVTRMLADVERAIARSGEPATLLGSSLGGFVSLILADRLNRPGQPPVVPRLVLLAPAVDVGRRGLSHLAPDEIARWRGCDRLDVFHHAYGKMMPLRFALHEDALRYDVHTARVDVPVLIFQGRRDESVAPESVVRYAESRPNVTLRLVDDDHQLMASLDTIWRETAAFLGLG